MKDFIVFFKKYRKQLNLVLTNLVLLIIFLEIGSLAVYWLREKSFFYLRGQTSETDLIETEILGGIGINLEESVHSRFHPFLGFVIKPNVQTALPPNNILEGENAYPLVANNYGFFSPYQYPYQKDNQSQYIIGIFGGSVALNLALYEREHRMISQALEKLPSLVNREIIVLPFALGGYKEPQQLLTLNYFLSRGQEFDLVINIDGFNEVALSNLNNQEKVEASMPSVQHLGPLTQLMNSDFSPQEIDSLWKINHYKQQIKKSLSNLKTAPLAAVYLWNSLKIKGLIKSYQQEALRFDKMRSLPTSAEESIVAIHSLNTPLADSQLYSEISQEWRESSILMQDILAQKNIPYFHFIQPNQYYQTQRVFTEEEQKIAVDKTHPYLEGVQKGYPFLLAEVENLRKSGVQVANLVNIFDQTPESVYVDTCCHLNLKGNEILSQKIAEIVTQALQPKNDETKKAKEN